MIRITIDNMILIITDTCPADRARLAVSCLDRRGPRYVEQTGISDSYGVGIPKFSAFIGQLGAKIR